MYNCIYVCVPVLLYTHYADYCYSGRTERQALADALNRPAPTVVRTPSKRHHRRASLENQPGS